MSTKPVFNKIAKHKGRMFHYVTMWTYDICVFDIGTYYDYY